MEDGCCRFSLGTLPVIMPQKLRDVAMLGRCSHEFSWPRRSENGEYYQVCMLCATAYRYDWKTMRRGKAIDEPVAETTAVGRRTGRKQAEWMPRARRLRSKIAVRYRTNFGAWHEGVIQNISQSGVLFHGPQQMPAEAPIELIFEMPEEISGQKDSSALCQGKLIRVQEALDDADDTYELAASILDYKFLRPTERQPD
jgi:PilZ domain